MTIRPGSHGSVDLAVSTDDTAIALRSGDVPVLATPRLVALFEEASVRAVSAQLDAGQTTVGMRVQVDHLAPSGVGDVVTAEATLEKIEGRRLIFTVSAHDERGLIGAGRVTRVVVDTDRFLERLS